MQLLSCPFLQVSRVGALVTLFPTPNPLFGVQAGLVFEVSQERRSAPVSRFSLDDARLELVRGRDTEPALGVQTGSSLRLERKGSSCENRGPWTCCAQAGAGASASDLPLGLVLARVLLLGYGELAPYFMCVLLCCVIVEVIIIIHNYLYFSNTIFHPRAAPRHDTTQFPRSTKPIIHKSMRYSITVNRRAIFEHGRAFALFLHMAPCVHRMVRWCARWFCFWSAFFYFLLSWYVRKGRDARSQITLPITGEPLRKT